jgi:DEAD/DEAH box helicase domain-containing protein
MWIDVPSSTLELLRSKDINPAGAIHSAEHAFLNRFALASDLKTECKAPEKEYNSRESQRKRPARLVSTFRSWLGMYRSGFLTSLIFYDCAGKDSMISVKAFDQGGENFTVRVADLKLMQITF